MSNILNYFSSLKTEINLAKFSITSYFISSSLSFKRFSKTPIKSLSVNSSPIKFAISWIDYEIDLRTFLFLEILSLL